MRNPFRIAIPVILLTLVLVGLTAPAGLVNQASGAVPPANGKLLYAGNTDQLGDLGGGRQTLPFMVDQQGRFSPDGSMIATDVHQICAPTCANSLSVHTSTGSTKSLAFTSEEWIEDVTWSPDQRQLAISVLAGNGFDEYNIWVVPLDGSAPHLAIASTATFKVDEPGIAWRPTSNEIAFVGHPYDEDHLTLIEDDQPYLIRASGGSPTRFNAPLPNADCSQSSCRRVSYFEPAWSPDGSKLAMYVDDETFSDKDDNGNFNQSTLDEYLGVVASGQIAASRVTDLQQVVNPTDSTRARFGHPVWSANGRDILYARFVGADVKAAVVTIQGGAEIPVDSAYLDWQPCPTGTCVLWGAREKADLKLTVSGYDKTTTAGKQDKITATVTNLGPDPARNVEVNVATPKGMFYTDVGEPPAPWACDQLTKGSVTCGAPELAPGAKASFTVGLLALDVRSKAELVVRASTESDDPVSKNDTVRLNKKLAAPKAPKLIKGKNPPTAPPPPAAGAGAGACSYPSTPQFYNFSWCSWPPVAGKPGLYYTVTNLTCSRGGSVGDDGYISGTLWMWEGGKSGVTKLMVNARRQAESYGILKGGERNKSINSGDFANDRNNHKTWMTFSWENGAYDAYGVTAQYKWVKKGLRPNVKRDIKVIANC